MHLSLLMEGDPQRKAVPELTEAVTSQGQWSRSRGAIFILRVRTGSPTHVCTLQRTSCHMMLTDRGNVSHGHHDFDLSILQKLPYRENWTACEAAGADKPPARLQVKALCCGSGWTQCCATSLHVLVKEAGRDRLPGASEAAVDVQSEPRKPGRHTPSPRTPQHCWADSATQPSIFSLFLPDPHFQRFFTMC